MKIPLLLIILLLLATISSCQDVGEEDTEPLKVKVAESPKADAPDESDSSSTDSTAQFVEPAKTVKEESCGDSVCSSSENKCTCPDDCGKCQGFASNLTQYKCVKDECVLARVDNICGNGVCEANEQDCRSDCPDCADGDACTIDTFDSANQKCVHKQAPSCCGNSICDPGEEQICLIDCLGYDKNNVTLARYPYPFVDSLKFNSNIIVGSNGSAEIVLAGIDLIRPLVYQEPGAGYSANALLDSQVASIKDKNVFLIGNACQNRFVRNLMIPPENKDCHDGIKPNHAMIQLFKTGEDTYALVIAGYSGKDTRSAAQILSYYNQTKPHGLKVLI